MLYIAFFINSLHVTALKKARSKLKQVINQTVIGNTKHASQNLKAKGQMSISFLVPTVLKNYTALHMWDAKIKTTCLPEGALLTGKSFNTWFDPSPQYSSLVSVDKFCAESLQGACCSFLTQRPVSTFRSNTMHGA